MELEQLRKTLIMAAKQTPVRQDVPIAFEKRIMHIILSTQQINAFEQFASALWKAVIPSASIAIATALLLLFANNLNLSNGTSHNNNQNTLEEYLISSLDTQSLSW